jgi:ABC-type phosphate/phosphonate transport system substrate-binding protein
MPGMGLPIANARMYNSAGPACKLAWRELLAWVTARAGTPMEIIDHDPPALLSELWERDNLGATLMCGLPYALRKPAPVVIAAPVPSPPHYQGRAVYFSYLLVPARSTATRLEDTFGGTVGYTLEDSMSGCVALRCLLERHRRDGLALYSKVVGNLIHVRGIVEAVGSKRVDIGSCDSYVFDLLTKHDPEFVTQVKVIGMTDPAPMPPFVATASLAPEALGRLREAFRAAGAAPELENQRETLLLSGFEVPAAGAYDVFRAIHALSERHAGVW